MKSRAEIDFVIMWVNGNDPIWKEKKQRYLPNAQQDDREIRYRDWGLLRYWFRAVEQCAPWVRRIYFISDGQKPAWLNEEHPQLRITDHRDFIPLNYLPTFSANPIELNLHRLPELAEQFVFFNDDMFLLQPVRPEDFFVHGLPVDDAVLSPIMLTKKQDIGNIVANDMAVINTYFDKRNVIKQAPGKWMNPRYGQKLLRTLCLMPWRHFAGFYNDHLPQPFLKQTFCEIWHQEADLLEEVCTHRFRDYQRDVNQWLMRYWQFGKNCFIPGSPYRGKDLNVLSEETVPHILKRKTRMICINDSDEISDFAKVRENVEHAFQQIFPERSRFEKEEKRETGGHV